MQLSEPLFSDSVRVNIVDEIIQNIESARDNTTEITREVMLDFSQTILEKLKHRQTADWFSIFIMHSLREIDRLHFKYPEMPLSDSEFELIMTIAKHAHQIGIYNKAKNNDAIAEHSEALVGFIFQALDINDRLETLQNKIDDEDGEKDIFVLKDLIYPIVENKHIQLIFDVSSNWENVSDEWKNVSDEFFRIMCLVNMFRELHTELDSIDEENANSEEATLKVGKIILKHSIQMLDRLNESDEDFSEAVD